MARFADKKNTAAHFLSAKNNSGGDQLTVTRKNGPDKIGVLYKSNGITVKVAPGDRSFSITSFPAGNQVSMVVVRICIPEGLHRDFILTLRGTYLDLNTPQPESVTWGFSQNGHLFTAVDDFHFTDNPEVPGQPNVYHMDTDTLLRALLGLIPWDTIKKMAEREAEANAKACLLKTITAKVGNLALSGRLALRGWFRGRDRKSTLREFISLEELLRNGRETHDSPQPRLTGFHTYSGRETHDSPQPRLTGFHTLSGEDVSDRIEPLWPPSH